MSDNPTSTPSAPNSNTNWQNRATDPSEAGALSRVEPENNETTLAPQSATFNLRMEKTPSEFAHLYAALERQVAGMGDLTLMTNETLGTDRPYVLGITSALDGEGKTTTALHLAMTIARDTFKRVCLIDMSLGTGDLSDRLGVPVSDQGMVSALEETENIVPTLQLADCDNLVIIPAGRPPKNASKLARSPRVAQMLISARHSFDVVIVDLPSVSSDNALPLARHVDGILVVARAGVTPAYVVSRTLDTLGRDKVIGVALNQVKSSIPNWLLKRFSKA